MEPNECEVGTTIYGHDAVGNDCRSITAPGVVSLTYGYDAGGNALSIAAESTAPRT